LSRLENAHRAIVPGDTLRNASAAKVQVELHLAFLRAKGALPGEGSRILDFGCGLGGAVEYLCAQGYDAYGVDTNEWWGADRGRYRGGYVLPPPDIVARLRHSPAGPAYRLPFPDGYFDYCFSNQVFEHIGDYPAAFRELARVVKPEGVSLHIFPGPNYPIEGHVELPIAWLCYWRPYLAFWALIGRRACYEHGMSWRETVAENLARMGRSYYPTKRRLRRLAAAAGVELDFLEAEALPTRNFGGMAALYRRLHGLGLGRLARTLLPLIDQRYMRIRRPAHGS
jgi:SAM-dependent methyltransferase